MTHKQVCGWCEEHFTFDAPPSEHRSFCSSNCRDNSRAHKMSLRNPVHIATLLERAGYQDAAEFLRSEYE